MIAAHLRHIPKSKVPRAVRFSTIPWYSLLRCTTSATLLTPSGLAQPRTTENAWERLGTTENACVFPLSRRPVVPLSRRPVASPSCWRASQPFSVFPSLSQPIARLANRAPSQSCATLSSYKRVPLGIVPSYCPRGITFSVCRRYLVSPSYA